MKIARFASYSSSKFQSINVMSVGRNLNVSHFLNQNLYIFRRWYVESLESGVYSSDEGFNVLVSR